MTILGRSEELVSRCVECDLAEPESLASLGGSAPGVVDGILSTVMEELCQVDRVGSATKLNCDINFFVVASMAVFFLPGALH